jgi:predicted metal-dependent phosphoesterase TrpH
MKYDLHVHSFYSKKCGHMNPKDIVKTAIKNGLDGVAITDHDTIKGGLKAKEYEQKDFQVIQYFTNWIEKSFSFIPISKYFSVKCLKS